ncbi:MAG: domain S-box/diguanylate cyclase protein [Acidimicrobiales bacterium]|nr:domain S-box/diguanylate cyclase protein [Acidimicrobiales bacterium]
MTRSGPAARDVPSVGLARAWGESPTSEERTQAAASASPVVRAVSNAAAEREHADDVAKLHRAATLPDDDPVRVLGEHLAIGRRVTRMEVGIAATIDGGRLVVEAVSGALGAAPALGPGFDLVADERAAAVLAQAATVAHLAGVGRQDLAPILGDGASVGSPVWVGGRVVGIVLFVADRPRALPFDAWQMSVVDLVADGVARVLEQAAGARERTEHESRTQALLDLIPDRIHRVDRDGRMVGELGPGPPFDPAPAEVPADPEGGDQQGVPLPAPPAPAVQVRVRQIVARTIEEGRVRSEVFAAGTGALARRYEARFVPAGADEVLCIVRDVTDRHRAERALAEQVAFEALAASISTRLIGRPIDETDAVVVGALAELAQFFDADSAYLDRPGHAGGRGPGAHEWRGTAGALPEDGTDVLDRSGMGWLRDQLRQASQVFVRATDELPPEAAVEQRAMRDRGQRAALWVRLGDDAEVAPVLGLVWKRQPPATAHEVLGLVRFVGEALLGALRRRDVAKLAAGQAEVFELIARGAPRDETLRAVTNLLSGDDEQVVAVALVLAEDGSGTVAAATPALDDARRELLGGAPSSLDSPVGMAVATGEIVRVHDLPSDDRFPEGASLARRLGARSLVAVPVQAPRSGRTLAVLLVLGTAPGVADRVDPGRRESCEALVAVAVERAEDDARLAFQATHDPLTGVANRAALLDRLSVALARSRRTGRSVAVLFCDLDRFKAVNDRFGHDRGDQLLIEVADRISDALRPSDTVCRLGGDEFVVLCEDLEDPTLAMVVAERVGRAVEAVDIVLGGEETRVTASIGVAVSSGDLDNPESLIRDADMAMYRAKSHGRARRELFRPAPEDEPPPPEPPEAELVEAMANGRLRLDLQPVVAADGTLVGVEALVRLDDPSRGEVGPEEILATAERGGVVTDIGRWVVSEALAQRRRLLTLDPRLASVPIHVNLTARDLAAPGFLDHLQHDLDQGACPAASFVVELHERALGALGGSEVLDRLRDAGIAVVVDGFGVGGEPLASLPGLHIAAVKLDRSLVEALEQHEGAWEVAAAVAGLAHGLGLRALAVGVETTGQLQVLRALGYDGIQGDLVGPPGPADDVLGRLQALLPSVG